MTENAVYAYSEENRDPVERTSIPLFHYFVNNVNLGGEKNVPVKIQTRDILTGKNPGTHYYTHVLDNNKVKTSGPVSGAESSRIDSNANADLHNEETKAPSDNSIPESSENSNTNFAEEDTDSQPYSTDYKIPTSWYNSYYKTKAADRITTPQSTKSTPQVGDILLPSTADQSIAEKEQEIKDQFSKEGIELFSFDDSAYWESMPEDSEQIAEANTTYDYSKPFAEQVDDWKAGLIPQIDSLVLGATPSIWQRVGFNALPVTINQTHVDYALNNTKDSDHYIGEAALKDLPNQIERPVAIIQSQSDPKRAVVIIRRVHNGKNIINAVEVDGQARLNRRRTDSNAITSVYAATNALGMLNDALHHESAGAVELFYWNKREAYTLLRGAGLRAPSGLPRDGFVHSIRDPGSNVNTRLNSVTESTQFKQWFGNSTEVNEDGTPKIEDGMYTNADGQKKSVDNIGTFDRINPDPMYSTDDSAYWESMPEDQELLRNAAARDDANPEVTAWGKKQERIETLDRKANNLREAMQENETKARREHGTSL